MSEYAERDPMELDRMGGHYTRHIMAMTEEDLHDKSEIAAELAWRDAEIERLKKESIEQRSEIQQLRVKVRNAFDAGAAAERAKHEHTGQATDGEGAE